MIRRSFQLGDLVAIVVYLSLLLWLGQQIAVAKTAGFKESRPGQQVIDCCMIMLGIGSVSTLPLLWLSLTLAFNSRENVNQRQTLIPPVATLLAISYGTIAVGNPVTAMGIATALIGLACTVVYHFDRTVRLRWILMAQAMVYLIAGLLL